MAQRIFAPPASMMRKSGIRPPLWAMIAAAAPVARLTLRQH
jgi:hypothetical protein